MEFQRTRIKTKYGVITFDSLDKWMIVFVLLIGAIDSILKAADVFVEAASVGQYLHGALLVVSAGVLTYLSAIFREFVNMGFRSIRIVVNIADDPRGMELVRAIDEQARAEEQK